MDAIWSRITTAHAAMHSPGTIDTEHIKNGAIVSACAFVIIATFDMVVARRFRRVYFALHVFANAVISSLTVAGAFRALANPTGSTVPSVGTDAIFMCWVYALHIYHPLVFKTNRMDWVHHIPVYILNTLMLSVRCGDAIQLKVLILCGLPGGLDYVLQVLEGEGLLARAKYKDWCAQINQWCRVPLGVISGYVILLGLYHQWAEATTYEAVVFTLMGLNAIHNPLFFGRQAVEANIVDVVVRGPARLEPARAHTHAQHPRPFVASPVSPAPAAPPQNRFGLVGRDDRDGLRLPKVRSLSGKGPKVPDAYPVGKGAEEKKAA